MVEEGWKDWQLGEIKTGKQKKGRGKVEKENGKTEIESDEEGKVGLDKSWKGRR